MTPERCRNCGQELTEENVALAKKDSGILFRGQLSYYCPAYNDECGCRSYQRDDETKAAYWEVD